MKLMKKFSILFYIVMLSIAFGMNMYYINSKGTPSNLLSFKLNAIYFDPSLIEDSSSMEKVQNFITSNNMNVINNIINKNEDPIGQFYAFCSYLRYNKTQALTHLENLLTSQQKVNIVIDKNTKILNSDLGHAILLLIAKTPEKLIAKLDDNFFNQISPILLNAYKSKINKSNKNYKRELVYLIAQRTPLLISEITKDIINTKPINEMNDNEKLELSLMLPAFNKTEKEKIYISFFNETNEQILINTLNSINKDDFLYYTDLILNIYKKNISKEINNLALDKYLLLSIKHKDIGRISSLIRSGSQSVIITALEKIGEYGDDYFYEFLKPYLQSTYDDKINVTALKSIFLTTAASKPLDVQRTINYILVNMDKDMLILECIKFNLANNINSNSSAVLYRLKRQESLENKELKEIGLKYIDYFNLATGIPYLKELLLDPDQNIRTKAQNLLNTKFKNVKDETADIKNN
ncbi:MAG: hypothetical protein JXB50_11670 [Spirochaetes bacterium]|nr:hypothetical protein [Spirochaetota bacterium]